LARFALAVLYSAVHWFLVLSSITGSEKLWRYLGTLSFSDAMLVLAVALVGSVLQFASVAEALKQSPRLRNKDLSGKN